MTSSFSTRGRLCRLDDLKDPGSRGFPVFLAEEMLDIFVVRQGEHVYGYLNRCPHTRGPLDWLPDQFLDLACEYIQCATHGALFRIADGLCVYGPCAGDRLTPVPTAVEAGEVVLFVTNAVIGTARD
jgi:nitrite reductase/ring-hydroxylating ferredoxin subunit